MAGWAGVHARYLRASRELTQAQTELSIINDFARELGWRLQKSTRRQDAAMAAPIDAHHDMTDAYVKSSAWPDPES